MYKRYLITLLAISLLTPAAHADSDIGLEKNKDAAGFGLGAIIGGLAGGPVGAIAGAAGGAWLGARAVEKDQQQSELKGDLAARTAELEQLREQLTALEDRNDRLQNVRLDRRKQSAERLSQAINLAVYFRTDSSEPDAGADRRLRELADYLTEYPQIRVHVAGHADRRGSPAYNLALSRRRAESVAGVLREAGIDAQRIHIEAHGQSSAEAEDIEGYIFDRRVNIALSVTDPV